MKKKGELNEYFFFTLAMLSEVTACLKDSYLRTKLQNKTYKFFNCFLACLAEKGKLECAPEVSVRPNMAQTPPNVPEGKDSNFERKKQDVAQYNFELKQLAVCLNELYEFIDLIIYGKFVPLSPALAAQKRILEFLSAILDTKTTVSDLKEDKKGAKPEMAKPETENHYGYLGDGNEIHGELGNQTLRSNQNLKEKILKILQENGSLRTSEIISKLNGQYAVRTVQRHLMKMAKEESLIRDVNTKIPKYSLNPK